MEKPELVGGELFARSELEGEHHLGSFGPDASSAA
jgi:hypothetical protein